MASLFVLLALHEFALCTPQQAEPPPRELRKDASKVVRQLNETWGPLGEWEDSTELMESALDQVWERNQWHEEADDFALQVAKSVGRIPPWDIPGRIQLLTEMAQERYHLSNDQRLSLSRHLQGEVFQLIGRHGGLILKHAREGVQALTQDPDGITPELVAQWMRESEPFHKDALAGLDRLVESFSSALDPEQKRIWERDFQSLQKRRKVFEHMTQEWAQGRWQPEQWGFRPQDVKPRVETVLPYDETTWDTFVQQQRRRFDLNPAQLEAASSVLRELVSRAQIIRRTQHLDAAMVPPNDPASDPRLEPIRSLFADLDERINRLLTEHQRTLLSPDAVRFDSVPDHPDRLPANSD